MKIQFEFTEEDLIDSNQRFYKRSKFHQKNYKKILAGYIIFIFILSFLVYSGELLIKILFAIFFSFIFLALYPLIYRREQRNRLKKHLKEFYGSEGPFICEIELTPNECIVSQWNVKTFYKWENIKDIIETPDSIDIFTKNASGVIVRKKAFNSIEEEKKFLNLAGSYLQLSRKDEQN